jgi:hypothetical protein
MKRQLPNRRRQDADRRAKRAQAAAVMTRGAKSPTKAIGVAGRPSGRLGA